MQEVEAKLSEDHCPLCGSGEVSPFFRDKKRSYQRCKYCKLVFVPKQYWLTIEDERAEYDLHENDAQDPGYRQFLSRLSTPLLERLLSGQRGLDFGCGPAPTLSLLLEEKGQHMDLYDPLYYNNPAVFDKKYDFICASEVVEHLRYPNKDFISLFRMLKPGGWLGIMTKLVLDKQAFSQWHYTRDMTHICFFSRSTFEYLALRFNSELTFFADDVILLNKK